MNKIMLIYPPGKAYQRSEDRAQCNIDDSAATSIHACNDIGYAAAILKKQNYDVFLRDYQTEKVGRNEVEKDVIDFRPDIIIISTTNATVLSDIEFINRIYDFHKCEFIIKGAIFFDISEKHLVSLDLRYINYLIGGEIETIIEPLVNCILRNKGSFEDIPGIIYRNGGSFRKTAFDVWQDNLDTLPFPARELMKNELYTRPDTGEAMATIQVSKGCPANCIYCLTPIISGKKVRKRSVETIFEEICECYYRFGIKNFFFKADTFTIETQWAEELCNKIINSDLCGKIEFTVNSRVKPLEVPLLEKLKKAGCFMLAVGFESGNAKTLQLIKKGTCVDDNLRAAKIIKKVGIPLFGFFMIGFPWETREDIINTLDFMLKINPDFIELHIAMPYYGTELYDLCERFETIKCEAWGKDYFSPNTFGTTSVTINEIIKLKKKYLLKFYLRPKYILKKFYGSIANPSILKNYIVYGYRLLKNNIIK